MKKYANLLNYFSNGFHRDNRFLLLVLKNMFLKGLQQFDSLPEKAAKKAGFKVRVDEQGIHFIAVTAIRLPHGRCRANVRLLN